MDPHPFAGQRFASASVIAHGRGRVVQMLCAPGSFGAVLRAPHMLKIVAICSNLLVRILLGVWLVGGIEFDVTHSHIGPI